MFCVYFMCLNRWFDIVCVVFRLLNTNGSAVCWCCVCLYWRCMRCCVCCNFFIFVLKLCLGFSLNRCLLFVWTIIVVVACIVFFYFRLCCFEVACNAFDLFDSCCFLFCYFIVTKNVPWHMRFVFLCVWSCFIFCFLFSYCLIWC